MYRLGDCTAVQRVVPNRAHNCSDQGSCQGHRSAFGTLYLRLFKKGANDDKIWSIVNTNQCSTEYGTFDDLDAMLARVAEILQAVCNTFVKENLGWAPSALICLKNCWANGFLLDFVEIKLQRLIAHLQYVVKPQVFNAFHSFLLWLTFSQLLTRFNCTNTTVKLCFPDPKAVRQSRRAF